jgi:hypothetical protein
LKGRGHVVGMGGNRRLRDPVHRRMRAKLRSTAGRREYQRRKTIVEPVFGVLKEQRGMRRFRLRSITKVAAEFTLAAISYNLTRLYRQQQR